MNYLPNTICLYGPAGCGKGTQAMKLLRDYPEYIYIELGEVLRTFVSEHKEINNDNGKVASRMHILMEQGSPVDFEDWKHVWNQSVSPLMREGKKLLIDGIFREFHQTRFLCNELANNGGTICLFVLHIPLEEAVVRLRKRFYVPGSRQPYMSYDEAKVSAGDLEPISRSDDQDPEVIRRRYKKQYELEFGRALSAYQRITRGELFIIDGERIVEDVYSQMHQDLDWVEEREKRLQS